MIIIICGVKRVFEYVLGGRGETPSKRTAELNIFEL